MNLEFLFILLVSLTQFLVQFITVVLFVKRIKEEKHTLFVDKMTTISLAILFGLLVVFIAGEIYEVKQPAHLYFLMIGVLINIVFLIGTLRLRHKIIAANQTSLLIGLNRFDWNQISVSKIHYNKFNEVCLYINCEAQEKNNKNYVLRFSDDKFKTFKENFFRTLYNSKLY